MKKVLENIVLWVLYVGFGALLGWVSYEHIGVSIVVSLIIAFAGTIALMLFNEFIDRKFGAKPTAPEPSEFLEANPDIKGARAIVREYIAVGGNPEKMRVELRSRAS